MLFDLRGRGRRRTVQVIYLSLAILMGGGLVLFGIGGATSGGLVDAITGNQTEDVQDIYAERVKSLETRIAAQPQNAQLQADLARAQFQRATTGEGFDQATGTFTEEGRADLQAVKRAWERHVELAGDGKVDANVARLMVQAFGQTGLNDPGAAVGAMEEVISGTDKPTAALYAQYAILAFTAGQNRKGELAERRAVSLAPEAQREQIKAQIEASKSSVGVGTNPDGSPQITSTTGG
jgi:hypothetical protein